MGPLEGLNIISPELDFVFALLIGIAFGFVLEQAGFSSSRRLAGLFYGSDFVVLRVFFTAAVTTVLGVILLDYLGYLDSELIYINPTFVKSAIIGGVIMGLGFIMGGFCPGTGICAASIGKIDAIVFVIGLFIGVFLFAELYPFFESIYHANDLGDIKIYDSLGMSKSLFIFLLVCMALFAFVFTYFIERKVTKKPSMSFKKAVTEHPYHSLGIILVICITIIIIQLPDRKTKIEMNVANQIASHKYNITSIPTDELAFKILQYDKNIAIVDVRDEKNYNLLAIPGSVNIPVEKLFDREWEDFLGNITIQKIFVADNQKNSLEAALIAKEIGYKNIYVLEGGMNAFTQSFLTKKGTVENIDTAPFMERASFLLQQMIAKNKQPKVKKKVLSKAKGGC